MGLPATFQEAAAVDYAERLAKWIFDNGTPGGSDSFFTAAASRAWFRNLLGSKLCLGNMVGRKALVASAMAGDQDVIAVLKQIVLEAKSRRMFDQLPIEIVQFSMWCDEGGLEQLDLRSERDSKLHVSKSIAICMSVAAIVDRYGLRPTGSSHRHLSACQVEAKALKRAQLYGRIFQARAKQGEEHKNIERLWAKFGRAMPTVPGWARDFEPWNVKALPS